MKNLFKEIIYLFLLAVFANVLVELGEENKSFLVNPVKFFGTCLTLSIIGGSLMFWFKSKKNKYS